MLTRLILVVSLVATAVTWTTTAATAAHRFGDVPDGHAFHAAVDWLVAEGITSGTTATTYAPSTPVSRAQMAAFLWRYGNEPTPARPEQFADVPADAYYADAVAWLAQVGVTTGVAPGRYEPAGQVTRAQMAAFLWRLSGRAPAANDDPGFSDVADTSPFRPAIAWLVESGVTTGTTATTYSPSAPVTRGQMAAFLWRLAAEPAVGEPGLNRLTDDVVVVDTTDLASGSVDPVAGTAELTFDQPVDVSVGELVVVPPSPALATGTFGRVTAVAGGNVRLEQVPMEDFFGDIDWTATAVPVADGTIRPAAATSAWTPSCTREVSDGHVTLNPPKVGATRASFSIERRRVVQVTKVSLIQHVDVSFGATAETSASFHCAWEYDSPSLVVAVIPLPVPIPPLVVDLEVEADAVLSGHASSSVTVDHVETITAGFAYQDGSTRSIIERASGGPQLSETEEAGVELDVFVGPEVDVSAGGWIGVGLSAGPGFNGTVATCEEPWWTLRGDIRVGIEAELDLWVLEEEWSLPSASFKPWTRDGGAWPFPAVCDDSYTTAAPGSWGTVSKPVLITRNADGKEADAGTVQDIETAADALWWLSDRRDDSDLDTDSPAHTRDWLHRWDVATGKITSPAPPTDDAALLFWSVSADGSTVATHLYGNQPGYRVLDVPTGAWSVYDYASDDGSYSHRRPVLSPSGDVMAVQGSTGCFPNSLRVVPVVVWDGPGRGRSIDATHRVDDLCPDRMHISNPVLADGDVGYFATSPSPWNDSATPATLWRFSVASGAISRVADLGPDKMRVWDVSPDGRFVVVAAVPEDGVHDAIRVDTSTGEAKRFYAGGYNAIGLQRQRPSVGSNGTVVFNTDREKATDTFPTCNDVYDDWIVSTLTGATQCVEFNGLRWTDRTRIDPSGRALATTDLAALYVLPAR